MNLSNCKAERTGRCSFDCPNCIYESIKIMTKNNQEFTFSEFYEINVNIDRKQNNKTYQNNKKL